MEKQTSISVKLHLDNVKHIHNYRQLIMVK